MQSETQIRERQPNHRFVNFFELSGQELNAFANLVALNNGVVEIYIHPFFNANQVGNGLTSEKYGKEKAIEARISGRLADGQEKPRLIFEEDGYHEELESHFSDPNIKAIYVITKNNSAKPKHGEVDAVILIIQFTLSRRARPGSPSSSTHSPLPRTMCSWRSVRGEGR